MRAPRPKGEGQDGPRKISGLSVPAPMPLAEPVTMILLFSSCIFLHFNAVVG